MNNWKTLKRNSEHLYPYSFTLAKDQSQATDLLINALTQLAYNEEEFQGENYNQNRWNINLAKAIYQLSYKLDKKAVGDRSPFFNLPLQSRSALFLKEHLSMSTDMIGEVMGLKKIEVLALIVRAQDQLSQLMGRGLTIN